MSPGEAGKDHASGRGNRPRGDVGTHEIDLFESTRGRLEAIAYRLLGSAGDAEDAVQDVFLRWQAADQDQVDTPEAWPTKVSPTCA